jgi:hypothetical protein
MSYSACQIEPAPSYWQHAPGRLRRAALRRVGRAHLDGRDELQLAHFSQRVVVAPGAHLHLLVAAGGVEVDEEGALVAQKRCAEPQDVDACEQGRRRAQPAHQSESVTHASSIKPQILNPQRVSRGSTSKGIGRPTPAIAAPPWQNISRTAIGTGGVTESVGGPASRRACPLPSVYPPVSQPAPSPSVRPSSCPSTSCHTCLSACQSACLEPVCPTVQLPVHQLPHLSIRLSACLEPVCPTVQLPVHQQPHLSIRLSVSLSQAHLPHRPAARPPAATSPDPQAAQVGLRLPTSASALSPRRLRCRRRYRRRRRRRLVAA